jgi:hypothetical protein
MSGGCHRGIGADFHFANFWTGFMVISKPQAVDRGAPKGIGRGILIFVEICLYNVDPDFNSWLTGEFHNAIIAF